MKTKKFIFVTFQKEGIHKFPQAKSYPKFATGEEDDVSFLGYEHRHMFHFKVHIEVFHDDRELEFIQVKRYLESLYTDQTLQLNNKSCEMMSDDLYEQIQKKYGQRKVRIEVSEDNENGSYAEYTPELVDYK